MFKGYWDSAVVSSKSTRNSLSIKSVHIRVDFMYVRGRSVS